MRKRVRVLILAAILAAIVIPVDFALSLDGRARPLATPAARATDVSTLGPVLLDVSHRGPAFRPALRFKTRVPDSAGLLLLGTVLIGLAIAVRRAT